MVNNWIQGREQGCADQFEKFDPHAGVVQNKVARSQRKEVALAVSAAVAAKEAWAALPAVGRGDILRQLAQLMKEKRNELGRLVAAETGKSPQSALAEVDGAVSLGYFFAGEGQRLYGRTIPSGVSNRLITLIRQPFGIAGLIVPANTPAANVAWKIFPALICGNAVVLKSAEDAPATAAFFGPLSKEAGLPDGVLNIVHGLGEEAGAALVEDARVGVISFTGSSRTGENIAQKAASRFCRLSLELGGKNALVVCEDADMDKAVNWAVLSAFSNAGQRCSAASRILVFESVYERFLSLFLDRVRNLKVGPTDADDLGPLVSLKQLQSVLKHVEDAKKNGIKILCGGDRLKDPSHVAGFYMAPTVTEGVLTPNDLADTEVFGPVTSFYKVKGLREAVALANASPYGLTAAIHTQSLHKAHWFADKIQAGVVSVNAGTYGSEPHLPFGGLKRSGNGTREPGEEALSVYSELKNIYWNSDPEKIA